MMERRFRARKAFCGSQVRNISCTMADIWKASKYRRLDLCNDGKIALMDNDNMARCTSGLSPGRGHSRGGHSFAFLGKTLHSRKLIFGFRRMK